MAVATTKAVLDALSPYLIRHNGSCFLFEHEVDQAKTKLFSLCPETYANIEQDKHGLALVIGNTGLHVNRPLLKAYLIQILRE